MREIYFKDFITLQRGFDLPANQRLSGEYPIVASASTNGFHSQYKVEPPGVVTGRSGTLGEVQYITKKFWPLNTSLWVKDFKGNFPKYVYYFLKLLDLKRFNSGAGVPTLNRNDLDTLKISVHELKEQQKIASILSAYDDLIENNTRRIQILEEIARRIYEEWFVRFRFPRHENVKMVESELGFIPEGWQIKTVMDFGKVVTGKTPSKSSPDNFGVDIPFLKLPDMHNNVFCINTSEKLSSKGANSQLSKFILPNNLCVSCIGTVGIINITSVKCQTNQQINSILLDDLHNREFLYFALIGLRELMNQYGANGATMVNLNKTKFERLPIMYPEQKHVENYHEVVFSLFQMILNLQKKNDILSQTSDLLLPKLISGEIDVSGFPEPKDLRKAQGKAHESK